MTPHEVFEFYGGKSATAKRFGITYQSVKEWGDKDKVPALRQLAIEIDSGGALRADNWCLPDAATTQA